MSTTIDRNVVEMEFDNSRFESNVKTSMNTLEKLKSSLNFEKATGSLNTFEKAVGKLDFSPLANGIQTIEARFGIMEAVALSAISNITNRIVNMGIQMVKSLSTDLIDDGFSKYEMKTQGVQTIVNATGKSMDEVSAVMEKLNWFTDETSYNFVDMVSNIGKFTSAGVDLELAVTAMQGIATEASLSGQGINEASRAMYNFAQAIGTGVVRLMDWRSIENANMATQEFKSQIIESAMALGTLTKASDGTLRTLKGNEVSVTNFTAAMSDNWFTSEVLIDSLQHYGSVANEVYKYATENALTASEAMEEMLEKGIISSEMLGFRAFRAAQEAKTLTEAIASVKDAVGTGWMTTFELVFGNYEEAKVLWTDLANRLYDIFAEGGNARNEMLKEWKELASGGREEFIGGLYSILDGIEWRINAVKDAFHDIFPPMTAERLAEIVSHFRDLTDRFGAASVKQLDNWKRAFRGIFSLVDIGAHLVKTLIGYINPNIFTKFSGLLSDTAGGIGDWIYNLDQWIKTNRTFEKAIEFTISKVQILLDHVKTVPAIFRNAIDWLNKVSESLLGLSMDDIIANVAYKLRYAGMLLSDTVDALKKVGKNGFSKVAEDISKGFKPVSILVDGLGIVLRAGYNLIKSFLPAIGSLIGTLGRYIRDLGSLLIEAFENADFEKVMEAVNSGILATIGIQIARAFNAFDGAIFSVKNFIGVGNTLKGTLGEVNGFLSAMSTNISADILLKIAGAIAILAASIYTLSRIEVDRLAIATASIVAMFNELSVTMASINKLGDMGKGNSVIKMAAAVFVLATALKSLAKLPVANLIAGTVVITAIFTEIAIFEKVLSKTGLVKGTGALIGLATGILVLSSAVKVLASIPYGPMLAGLGALTAILTELLVFEKVMSDSGFAKGTSTLLGLAVAVTVLAGAVKLFATMSWEELARGMTGFTAILAELVIFEKLLSDNGTAKGAASLIGLSVALGTLAVVLRTIGSMNVGNLMTGLIGLAGLLTVVGVFSEGMSKIKGATVTAGTLLIFSSALLVMAGAMKVFATMSIGEMAATLLFLAGSLATFALAAVMLEGATKTILALSGAFVLFGVGVFAFGTGLVAISAGLAALAGSVDVVVVAIIKIVKDLIVAIPYLVTELAKSLTTALPAIVDLIVVTILALVRGIRDTIPETVVILVDLLVTVLKVLADNIGTVIVEALRVISALLYGIAAGLPDIFESFMAVFQSIVQGLVTIFKNFELLDVMAATSMVTALSLFFAAFFVLATEAALTTALLPSIAKNLSRFVETLEPFFESVADIPASVLRGAKDLSEMVLMFTTASFVKSITGWWSGSNNFVKFGEQMAKFAPYLKTFGDEVSGLKTGVVRGAASAAKAMAEVANSLPNQGGLISLYVGDNKLSKFGKELADFGPYIKAFSDSVIGVNPSIVKAAASAASAVSEMANNLPKHGGIKAVFTGDNTLSKFASELSAFAPAMAEYAEAVKDIDGNVVAASANAAMSLAALANELPNQGGMVAWFTGDNTLSKFAEDLAEFGPTLKAYADSVDGIDPSVVEASANAALTLAEFATNLPNQGGAVSWFTGDNTLTAFADELATFGPKLKEYADSVAGIATEDIEASANGATILANMAASLPDIGGAISWFMGDMDMVAFGDQLVAFGPKLKEYAESVTGITEESISGASNAVSSIAALSGTLDRNGGLVTIFTGVKDIGVFGDSLIEFGNGLSEYADTVKGVDATAVSASADVTKALVEIQNALPEKGLFGGGPMSLQSFGQSLVIFGTDLADYYDSIKNVVTAKLRTVTAELGDLLNVVDKMSDVNYSGANGFSAALYQLAISGLNKFTRAFENSKDLVNAAVASMFQAFIDGLDKKKDRLMDATEQMAVNAAAALFNTDTLSLFTDAGKSAAKAYSNGLGSGTTVSQTAGRQVANAAVKGMRSDSVYDGFYSAGSYAVDGFVSAISDNSYRASSAASSMAGAALSGARNTLYVHSPSRKMYEIGNFAGMGFVNALLDFTDSAYAGGESMADAALDGVNNAVYRMTDLLAYGIDTNPTIRPIMDLTDIQNGSNEMYRLMDSVDGYAIGGSYSLGQNALSGVVTPGMRSDLSMRSVADRFNSAVSKIPTGENTVTNTFYINGTNAQEIADEVSRIILHDVERMGSVWA